MDLKKKKDSILSHPFTNDKAKGHGHDFCQNLICPFLMLKMV